MPFIALNYDKMGRDYLRDRLIRIATILHESYHARMQNSHQKCGASSWCTIGAKLGSTDFRSHPNPEQLAPACDNSYMSATALGAEFFFTIVRNCSDCQNQLSDLAEINSDEAADWLNLEINSKVPIQIPRFQVFTPNNPEKFFGALKDQVTTFVAATSDTNRLNATVGGRTYGSYPPESFFNAMRNYIQYEIALCSEDYLCISEWKIWDQQVATLAKYLNGQVDSGNLDSKFRDSYKIREVKSTPKGDLKSLNVPEALAWLNSAKKAKSLGYNVPLQTAIPCNQFSGGCPRL
jgi:hypothetical protein